MPNLLERLAELLQPQAPGANRLVAPMANTWRGPDSAPNQMAMPAAPQGAAPASVPAPPPQQPAPQQTASVAAPVADTGYQPSGGGFFDGLRNLFGGDGAQKGRAITALMKDGYDQGTATAMVNDPAILQYYIKQKIAGSGQGEGFTLSEGQVRYDAQGNVIAQGAKKKTDLINAGQGRLYNPDTGQWITSPDKGTDAPTVQSFYDDKGQEYKAQWNPQTKSWEQVGGSKLPSGMSLKTNPDGTVELIQGNGAGQKLTEGQGKDIGFYTRGNDADKQLATMDTQLTDWSQQNADKIPLGLGNYMRTPEFRQAKQAADSFLTAILRKDTGAAITDQEFRIYGPMFLPVPGDDQGTILQKRRARQVALLAIRSGLGTAEAVAAANDLILGNGGTPGTPSVTIPGNPETPAPSGGNAIQVAPGVTIEELP